MERRTAPPPADGRPRQLSNGGFNKALMPAQAASLSPIIMCREKKKERPGVLRARTTRTMKLSSPDVRNNVPISYLNRQKPSRVHISKYPSLRAFLRAGNSENLM